MTSVLLDTSVVVAAVRSYGLVVAAVVREGQKPRSRFADLLIAATAHANGLDLHTRNGDDFTGLEDLVDAIAVRSPDNSASRTPTKTR